MTTVRSWTRGWLSSLLLTVLVTSACAAHKHDSTTSKGRLPPTVRWLANDARLAEVVGATEAAVIIAEAGAVGDRFTRVVTAASSACVLVMARASERIADVDLYVYAEDGSVLALDDHADARPNVLLCPPHPRHIYVTARIAIGQGVLAVAVQSVPAARASQLRAAFHIGARPSASDTMDASVADVERRLELHHRALGGGFTPIAQSSLLVDYRIPTVWGMSIEPGSCLDTLVLPASALSNLDLELIDETGRTVGRNGVTDSDPAIIACSEVQRNVTLQLRAHDGIGNALVVTSRGNLRTGRHIEHALDLSDAKDIHDLAATVHKSMLRAHAHSELFVAPTTIERAKMYQFRTLLESGCARFDVFAGKPSSGVRARMYSSTGELVATNGDAQYFPLVTCARGENTLAVEALVSGGPLMIEKSLAHGISAEANRHPRAIARLLQRAWRLGLPSDPSELGAIESITLRQQANWYRTLKIEVGKCVNVFVALDADATGVAIHAEGSRPDLAVGDEQNPETAYVQLSCEATESPCQFRISAGTLGSTQAGLFATLPCRTE